ncbi:MAG: chromate transporter [Burkholderiaceae bacterium]
MTTPTGGRPALPPASPSPASPPPASPPPAASPLASGQRPASLTALFMAFTSLALHGFGGVLPWAQRTLVDRHRWLTNEEFLEMLAFGQLFPGPNVVNVAIIVGDRFFGWRGAAVSIAGMLLCPSLLVLAMAFAYQRYADLTLVRQALDGMSAVAAGLIFGMALKLARSQRRHWRWLAFGVAAFVLVGLLRWPLGGALLLLAPIAIGLAWWRGER